MVNRLDVLRREVAHVSVATTPPAQRIRAVNEFDDVTAQEAQLRGVVGREVEEGVCVVGTLRRKKEKKKKKTDGGRVKESKPLFFYSIYNQQPHKFSLHLIITYLDTV